MADKTGFSPFEQLILDELRAFRDDFNDTTRDILQRVSSLETDNHAIMGNGNPGRMALAEKSIGSLKAWRWKVCGVCVGGSAIISVVVTVIKLAK